MATDSKTRLLYDAVSKDYDLGTFEEFEAKLQSPDKRQAFFDGVGARYNLGSFEEFESKVKKKEETQPRDFSALAEGIGRGVEARSKAIQEEQKEVPQEAQPFPELSEERDLSTPAAKPSRSMSGLDSPIEEVVEAPGEDLLPTEVALPSESTSVQAPIIPEEQALEGADPLFMGGEMLRKKEEDIVSKRQQKLREETFKRTMNIEGRRGFPIEEGDIPKTQEELDILSGAAKNYEILITSKLEEHVPEDLKLKAAYVEREREIINQIKSGELSKEDSTKARAKLIEINKQLLSSDNNKKLFNPVTGETVDQDKAPVEAIEYDGMVKNLVENKYSDIEDAYQASEKAIHKYDYYDEELDKPSGYLNLTYRDLSDPIKRASLLASNQFVDEQILDKSKLLKERWIDSKANVEAISRAIMVNEDPSQIERGFGGGAGFTESVEKGFMEAIDMGEQVTSTEGDFATRFVGVVRDAGKDKILTKAQVANTEQAFAEKLGYGVGASIPIMAEIAVTTALTEGIATEAVVAKNIKKIKDAFGTSKAGKLFGNTIEQGVKGYASFAPTSETGATGVGEGVAQGVMDTFLPEKLIGGKYGKLLNYIIRTVGGGTGETIQEVSGQYFDALAENGYDARGAFYDAFGRTPEERWENLALIGTTSLMFSGVFNSARLVMTKDALEEEIENGNIPEEDIPAAQEIINTMEEKIDSEEAADTPKVAPVVEEEDVAEEVAPTEEIQGVVDEIKEIDAKLDESKGVMKSIFRSTKKEKELEELYSKRRKLDDRLWKEFGEVATSEDFDEVDRLALELEEGKESGKWSEKEIEQKNKELWDKRYELRDSVLERTIKEKKSEPKAEAPKKKPTKKTKEDAVQERKTEEVPVQPEARVGEAVEPGRKVQEEEVEPVKEKEAEEARGVVEPGEVKDIERRRKDSLHIVTQADLDRGEDVGITEKDGLFRGDYYSSADEYGNVRIASVIGTLKEVQDHLNAEYDAELASLESSEVKGKPKVEAPKKEAPKKETKAPKADLKKVEEVEEPSKAPAKEFTVQEITKAPKKIEGKSAYEFEDTEGKRYIVGITRGNKKVWVVSSNEDGSLPDPGTHRSAKAAEKWMKDNVGKPLKEAAPKKEVKKPIKPIKISEVSPEPKKPVKVKPTEPTKPAKEQSVEAQEISNELSALKDEHAKLLDEGRKGGANIILSKNLAKKEAEIKKAEKALKTQLTKDAKAAKKTAEAPKKEAPKKDLPQKIEDEVAQIKKDRAAKEIKAKEEREARKEAQKKKAEKKEAPTKSLVDEVNRVESEIESYTADIEDKQNEIKTERENLKDELKTLKDKKDKIKKSKMSKAKKEEALEDVDAEIQDLKDDTADLIEVYKDEVKEAKSEITKLNKEKGKVEAEVSKALEEAKSDSEKVGDLIAEAEKEEKAEKAEVAKKKTLKKPVKDTKESLMEDLSNIDPSEAPFTLFARAKGLGITDDPEFSKAYIEKAKAHSKYSAEQKSKVDEEEDAIYEDIEEGEFGFEEEDFGELFEGEDPSTPEGKDSIKKMLDDLDNDLRDFGEGTLGMNMPVVVARAIVKAMKAAVSTATSILDIINAGIKQMKTTSWYKKASPKNKAAAVANVATNIGVAIDETRQVKIPNPLNKSKPIVMTIPESLDGMIDAFNQRIVDKFYDIRKAQRSVEKRKGSVSDKANFDKAEVLLHGKASNDLKIFEGKVEKLAKDMAKRNVSQQELSDYMYARHAQERNEYIRDNIDPKNHSGSGMTTSEANAILNSLSPEQITNLDALADQVYGFAEDTRNNMVKFGLWSEKNADNLRGLYNNYVPLMGFDADESFGNEYIDLGQALSVKGKEGMRATGRTTKAANVIANIISQHSNSIIRGRKNEAMQSLLFLVKDNKEIGHVIHPKINLDTKKGFNSKGELTDIPIRPEQNKNYVGVKIGGQQFYIKFKNDRMAKVVNAANIEKTNIINKTVGRFNRFLSSTMTSYNPEFVLTNFSRDIQAAMINMLSESDIAKDSVQGKKLIADTLKNVMPAMGSILKSEVGKKSNNPEMEQYYEEFKADGAKTGWYHAKDSSGVAKDIQNIIALQEAGTFSPRQAAKAWKSTKNFVEGVNTAVENAVRLSTYVSARKNGVSRSDAAVLAKELTVNFNRSGEWGTVMNSMYLFFNASVQGTARFAKAMLTLKKTVNADGDTEYGLNRGQKLAGAMVAFSSMQTLINQAISDDDEDGESFYSKIPDYEKERNMIIMNPNGRDYFKIPLPYGFNIFSNAGTMLTEVSTGEREVGDGTLFMIGSIINSFVPVSFSSSNDWDKKVVKGVTPTVMKPFIELAANEDYFGSTIYNENLPFGAKKPQSSIGRRSTWSGYKDLAEFLNEATGGNEYVSGKIDINPDKIAHIFKFMSGGTGKFVGRTVSSAGVVFDKARGIPSELEMRKVPFARVVYGEPSKYVDQTSYYDRRDEIGQIAEEYKNATFQEKKDPKFKGVKNLANLIKVTDKKLKSLRAKTDAANNMEDPIKRAMTLNDIEKKEKTTYSNFNREYNKYSEKEKVKTVFAPKRGGKSSGGGKTKSSGYGSSKDFKSSKGF